MLGFACMCVSHTCYKSIKCDHRWYIYIHTYIKMVCFTYMKIFMFHASRLMTASLQPAVPAFLQVTGSAQGSLLCMAQITASLSDRHNWKSHDFPSQVELGETRDSETVLVKLVFYSYFCFFYNSQNQQRNATSLTAKIRQIYNTTKGEGRGLYET